MSTLPPVIPLFPLGDVVLFPRVPVPLHIFEFVNALCQTLDLDPLEKQALLDCDGIVARYGRLAGILEFRALEQTFGKGSRS